MNLNTMEKAMCFVSKLKNERKMRSKRKRKHEREMERKGEWNGKWQKDWESEDVAAQLALTALGPVWLDAGWPPGPLLGPLTGLLTQGSELNTEKSSSIELSYLVTPSKFTLMKVLGWNLNHLSIKPNRVQLLYNGWQKRVRSSACWDWTN